MLHTVRRAVGPMLCAHFTSASLTACVRDASSGRMPEDVRGNMGHVRSCCRYALTKRVALDYVVVMYRQSEWRRADN